MAAACVEELLPGAIIWQESVQSQTFVQILTQGAISCFLKLNMIQMELLAVY